MRILLTLVLLFGLMGCEKEQKPYHFRSDALTIRNVVKKELGNQHYVRVKNSDGYIEKEVSDIILYDKDGNKYYFTSDVDYIIWYNRIRLNSNYTILYNSNRIDNVIEIE